MTRILGITKFLCAAIAVGAVLAQSPSTFAQAEQRVLAAYSRSSPQQSSPPTAARSVRNDKAVRPAALQHPESSPLAPPVENHRMLAPRSSKPSGNMQQSRTNGISKPSSFTLPKIESFKTASAGLAIVVGLFLVCMWLLRRSGPQPSSQLPSEAVSVLGRVPLAARNFAHLLQVGNKLVLVAITPEGVTPITEITDPTEVQRVLGLCLQNKKHSTSAEFHDVLKHLTKEPANGFLGKEATAYPTRS